MSHLKCSISRASRQMKPWNLHLELLKCFPVNHFGRKSFQNISHPPILCYRLPLGLNGKDFFTCSAGAAGDLGSIPGLGRCPGGGHGNPLQCSCLENPYGQRSLVGYSPWGRQESETWSDVVCMHAPCVTVYSESSLALPSWLRVLVLKVSDRPVPEHRHGLSRGDDDLGPSHSHPPGPFPCSHSRAFCSYFHISSYHMETKISVYSGFWPQTPLLVARAGPSVSVCCWTKSSLGPTYRVGCQELRSMACVHLFRHFKTPPCPQPRAESAALFYLLKIAREGQKLYSSLKPCDGF